MESAYYGGSVALAVVAVRIATSSVKSWWCRRTLTQQLVDRAETEQHELQYGAGDDEFLELPVETRKAPRKHGGVFRNFLVQEGKAKFGTPARNVANTMVVRKYLYDLCRDHGVIARHINDNLDFAVEMVFVPSEKELVAAAVRHTRSTKLRCSTLQSLVGRQPDLA